MCFSMNLFFMVCVYCNCMDIFVARHLKEKKKKHRKMNGGKLEDGTHYTTTSQQGHFH